MNISVEPRIKLAQKRDAIRSHYFTAEKINAKKLKTSLSRPTTFLEEQFGFHKDIQELVTILRKNCLPGWTFDKIIREYVNGEIGHVRKGLFQHSFLQAPLYWYFLENNTKKGLRNYSQCITLSK